MATTLLRPCHRGRIFQTPLLNHTPRMHLMATQAICPCPRPQRPHLHHIKNPPAITLTPLRAATMRTALNTAIMITSRVTHPTSTGITLRPAVRAMSPFHIQTRPSPRPPIRQAGTRHTTQHRLEQPLNDIHRDGPYQVCLQNQSLTLITMAHLQTLSQDTTI